MATKTKYLRHHLSSPFGEATPHDFEELVLSMRERGYDNAHPITLYEGQILAGWHRYLAAEKARVEPTTRDFEGSLEEARFFVYSENLPRRHMNPRQKATALLLMNAWLPPRQQLSEAAICARVGLKSTTLVNQLGRIAEADPEAAHRVANGEAKADTVIRELLHEDPDGDSQGTAPDSTRPAIVFTLKNRKLIADMHTARLKAGLAPQTAFNKAVELFVEWTEAGPGPAR